MALSLVRSRTLVGLQAHPVCVEVHLANGLPSFTLVGLADTEVKEARERVRSAIQNAGLVFPSNQRITVNLAPADVPKDSGRFDLPIALGILAASGQIDSAALAGYEFAGELSLGGELRPIRGALAMSLSAPTDGTRASTPTQWVLPPGSAEEAFGEILKNDFAGYRDELIISLNTVHSHASSIYAKCGVHSQREFMDLMCPTKHEESGKPRE